MNPEAPVRAADDHWLTVVHHRFRAWRGSRPFWAGLFTSLGGVPIAYFPYADLRLGNVTIAMATTAGAGSLIIGILLITLGFALWFQQGIRVFAGVASILLALVSLPVSNLGGFFLGFLFSLLGGALALSWAPGEPVEEDPEDAAAAKAEDFAGGPWEVPGPRDTETAYATETNAHADGGRNSAG
ncbi:DUF6114 domain-containing protein [Streptomyces sp. NBC_00091]|uniref:DUF6114 domain-containing protein n=1 Tax=Streptomyces sp. NBC_00091 TaxID=2975648 RepID=UPI002259F9D8|nr:DUF6114 domain-containing protein [Streptomyces sp. NBC_00091]MCX5375775.1 DUF6114 domain-containing protein [Streptomyces sp. NBC_00091]